VDWDEEYARRERWWSGAPNATLVTEVASLGPGTALEVGCGEGADAIWLAQQGWDVTGVDISQVALDRASRAAAEAGVSVRWERRDLVADGAPAGEGGGFDLVTVHYPALPRTPEDEAIVALLGAVAPGGTLLLVAHDVTGHHGHAGDDVPIVQPEDVVDHLSSGWTIDVLETRPRTAPPGHTGPDVPDVVLRARRSGSEPQTGTTVR
jgi:SAM-dependent methyltransferase